MHTVFPHSRSILEEKSSSGSSRRVLAGIEIFLSRQKNCQIKLNYVWWYILKAKQWYDSAKDDGINDKDEGSIGNSLIIIIILKYTFDRELNANSIGLLTSIK